MSRAEDQSVVALIVDFSSNLREIIYLSYAYSCIGLNRLYRGGSIVKFAENYPDKPH
jgi:hypothetical protein